MREAVIEIKPDFECGDLPSFCAKIPLSPLQKILLTTDGTLTDLIRILANEPIELEKVYHEFGRADDHALQQQANDTILTRQIILKGKTAHYLFASSQFNTHGFEPSIREQLINSDTPIGKIWQTHQTELYRQVFRYQWASIPELTPVFFPTARQRKSPYFIGRQYYVNHRNRLVGLINEYLPKHVFIEIERAG